MSTLNSFHSLTVAKRSSPTRDRRRGRNRDVEKHAYSDDSDDDSEYSYPSSPPSSRETSASYSSNRPMLRKKSVIPSRRPIFYRLPNRITRYLCLALISTIIIFIFSLVRMSVISAKKVEVGDLGERPPPPPNPWESFDFLARYYGGIRTLLSSSDNSPEYPLVDDELPLSNETSVHASTNPTRGVPASKQFDTPINNSEAYLKAFVPMQECYLDPQSTISVPKLHHFLGRPSGFPDHVIGSYELLGLQDDICFERYGRLGPYGYGYSLRSGGTGVGQHGENEGSEAVWTGKSSDGSDNLNQIDYRTVNWGEVQQRCYRANAARFSSEARPTPSSVSTENPENLPAPSEFTSLNLSAPSTKRSASEATRTFRSRTAVAVRSWDDFVYNEEDVMNLRAMISGLSLATGGEYDVHLLVEVKDEAKHPVWADADTYQRHLNDSVPEEFRGITTLWSQTQMLMLYQGIYDTYARGPTLPVHGSYRGLQMAMQYFAYNHQEYDVFWQWEMDIRYTGHYYDFFAKVDAWTESQPRRGLWERSSRFYIPTIHGTWEDFKQMVRVQTEMGTESPNNMWSGLNGAKNSGDRPKGDKPIWGPERPQDSADWYEFDADPLPPTTYEKDKYTWGVGEAADLITLDPLFDPDGTTWGLASDITGYNATEGLPSRRAAIVTASRMSRRLLNTMHRETAFKKHHAFSEMWPATAALHHGYKAVYVPHPMYVDRHWPVEYLAAVLNAGRNGATGGARTSVFGAREHNLLGMTWYYNAGFAPNLWRRWLGLKVNGEGGEEFETTVNEGRNGTGVNDMRGGEGRMCLPPMLIHPVKGIELPVEGTLEEEEIPESDPSA